MCVVKSPKVVTPEAQKAPHPVVIRNTYLDGIDPAMKAQRSGRSGLRIDAGSARVGSPVPSRLRIPTNG